MAGWPDTVKQPWYDMGYDPFTLRCWKPRKSPVGSIRVTSWKNHQWRGNHGFAREIAI